jgi:hypothetical protein
MPIGLEARGSNFMSITSVGLSHFRFFWTMNDFSDNSTLGDLISQIGKSVT